MALDLLDAPVRLTWSLPAAGSLDLAAVARGVAEAGVFYVTLQGRPLLNPGITGLVACLAGGGCQVMLECGGSVDEVTQLAEHPLKVQSILLDASDCVTAAGLDASTLTSSLNALRRCGHEPTLMLTPLRDNLMYVPDLMDYCRQNRVSRFKLSNASIDASVQRYSPSELLRPRDLARFRGLWRSLPADHGEGLQLEIHDLFLWEIMTPGQQQARSEYGGCQAANSLGHIDAYGVVHPCAAWPEPLGRLPEHSLEDIWSGNRRTDVRRRIASLPQGCEGCVAAATCLGGCRGLAAHLNREQGERDLMCPGPRG